VFGKFLTRSRYTNLQGCDYQIRGMDMICNVCEYRPAGYQVRKVGGGEAAWYASKNEAVGLGRDASPSSYGLLPSGIFLPSSRSSSLLAALHPASFAFPYNHRVISRLRWRENQEPLGAEDAEMALSK
jgi:hypothetical protein